MTLLDGILPRNSAAFSGAGRWTHGGVVARALCLAAVGVLGASAMHAQAPRTTPRISYVYPAGGQQGTTVTVYVGGQNLNGASAAYVTGPGVQARVVLYERPLTQRELNDLREQQQKLQEKRVAARSADKKGGTKVAFTAADEKLLEEIRQKLARGARRPPNPGLAETVTLEITLAPDAPPGDREIRVKASSGLSNPFAFSIGQLPEVSETVVTPTTPNQGPARKGAEPRTGRPRTTLEAKLPSIVNGQILPGEVDRVRFTARKDQRLVVAVAARALIPYLADAVPGWFQATVALFDSSGRELAYEDDFRFNPDPVLAYLIPADGEYFLEIKDSIYRGREDFVYRIAMGELPFVTSIYPLGCTFPERAQFELLGWNLPAERLAVETKDRQPGTFAVTVRNQGQFSNRVRFALDTTPEITENEPNNTLETAQELTLPRVVNGRIDSARDQDVFRFHATAGTALVAEVFARRLSSPLDSVVTVLDQSGKTLVMNDDHVDKGAALLTHHADSRASFTVPADGTYFIRLTDGQNHGGKDYSYRLHLAPPRPDFELRVTPATINARSGSHVPVTVYALRRDGFDGEINLALRNAPRGFALSGARIPAGEEKVHLTLFAGTAPSSEPIELAMVGTATIGGRTVAHPAVPAEDMMQAFAYNHLVPAQRLMASVTGRGGACRLISTPPLKIVAGGTARLELSAPTTVRGAENVMVEITDAPAGVTVQKATLRGDVLTVLLACDASKAKLGTKGNLLLSAAGERKSSGGKAKANRVPFSSIPAVPYEIVGPAGKRVAE